jgi:DNA-binding CsgD family transcriptional regulator
MDSPTSDDDTWVCEEDARAIVRLLGEVIAISQEIEPCRQYLMEGLCKILDADGWLWGYAKEQPFHKVLPSSGETPEERFSQLHATYFQSLENVDQSKPVFVSDMSHLAANPDMEPVILSGGQLARGGMVCVTLYRNPGSPCFGTREINLARIVLTETGWLYEEAFPEVHKTGKLQEHHHTVVQLLCKGRDRKTIAALLGVNLQVVHRYVREVYQHFSVHSQSELVKRVQSDAAANP